MHVSGSPAVVYAREPVYCYLGLPDMKIAFPACTVATRSRLGRPAPPCRYCRTFVYETQNMLSISLPNTYHLKSSKYGCLVNIRHALRKLQRCCCRFLQSFFEGPIMSTSYIKTYVDSFATVNIFTGCLLYGWVHLPELACAQKK